MVLDVFKIIFIFIWNLANIHFTFDGYNITLWNCTVFTTALALIVNKLFPKKED